MLQRHLAHTLLPRYLRPAHPIPPFFDTRGLEQEVGGGGRAEFEGEGAVRADGHARGDGGAGGEVRGAGVEFLGT